MCSIAQEACRTTIWLKCAQFLLIFLFQNSEYSEFVAVCEQGHTKRCEIRMETPQLHYQNGVSSWHPQLLMHNKQSTLLCAATGPLLFSLLIFNSQFPAPLYWHGYAEFRGMMTGSALIKPWKRTPELCLHWLILGG